jgi:hypothetical protein
MSIRKKTTSPLNKQLNGSENEERPSPHDADDRLVEEVEDEDSPVPADADDRLVDEQGEESFPASDPPAY